MSGEYSVQKILNAERFNLLSQDEINSVQNLRDLGQIEPAYNQLTSEEINGFKDIVNFFLPNSKEQEWTDYDYANMYQTTIGNVTAAKEGVVNFATNPNVQKEAAIIAGGIAVPMALAPITAGTSTAGLPVAITTLATKYPRLAKIIGAFTGGTGAATAMGEDTLSAMGYGTREAAGEGVVQGIAKSWPTIKKAGAPIFQKIVRGSLEEGAETAIKQLDAAGQVLTPAIASKNRVIDLMEGIAENAWIGGGAIREAREGAIDAAAKNVGDFLNTKFVTGNKELVNITDDFVQGFLHNASEESMDFVLKEFITKGATIQKGLIKTGYRNLDTIIQKTTGNGNIVNINGLKKFAKNMSKSGDMLDDAAKKILDDIAAMPSDVSFAAAQRLRSQFLEKTGYYTVGGSTAGGFSKKIAGGAQKIIDGSMDKAIKNLSNTKDLSKATIAQINESWRGVNALYKGSKNSFQSTLMTKIINGDPDAVYTSLIKGKHALRIKEFKNLIFNTAVKEGVLENNLAATKLWRKVQGEFFVDMIGRSIDGEAGILSAKSLLSKLKTFSGRGDRALNELFSNSPQILKDFKSFARTLELAQSKGIKGVPGGMLIQLMQASAIVKGSQAAAATVMFADGNVSWLEAGGMGLILGGPKVIAKMFTDPNFMKGVMATTRNKIGNFNYTRGAVQIINSYVTQGMFSQDEAVSKINEGISIGSLNKSALKTFEQIQKADQAKIIKEDREKKIIKNVKEKTKQFAEWTGLS